MSSHSHARPARRHRQRSGHGWARAASILPRLAIPALLASLMTARGAAEPGTAVAVVYNSRLAGSRALADHYAQRRGVPGRQVLGFELSTNEIISRAEFRQNLQKPLFDELISRRLFVPGSGQAATNPAQPGPALAASSIRYLVLCHGVPLKIQHDPALVEDEAAGLQPALRRNGAAVDSELAWLPALREKVVLSGPLPNPFYRTAQLQKLHPTNGVLLVARLDGPTLEVARGLVDKAMEAERRGWWGRAYFDARGLTVSSYAQGDQWIRAAAEHARRAGFETVLDDKAPTFADTFPLSDVALYAGWYEENACGPFAQAAVEFMPGALAYHLHSFSASTLRSLTRHWAGPLLAKGAAATVGYVDEPYLSFTSDLDVLVGNLLHRGASFGEAAWAAERALSWQTTVVGDPLYRPMGTPPDILHRQLELHFSRLVEWSHLLIVNRNLVTGLPTEQCIRYLEDLPFTRSSSVLAEKLGELHRREQPPTNTLAAFELALDQHPSPQQKLRLLGELAKLHTEAGHAPEAARALERLLRDFPAYPRPLEIHQQLLALARQMRDSELAARCEAEIQRLSPPPPAPATNPPAGPPGK